MEPLPTARGMDDKTYSQRKALETAKQMLHQSRGESRSPEMDWNYYGTHAHMKEQSRQEKEAMKSVKGKEFPKRAASTHLEEEGYPRNYLTLGLSAVERRYSCENCQRRHEPPLCRCPNCGRPHLISKCLFSGTPEGESITRLDYTESWRRCTVCQLCHQGTCPCAKCGELAHIATDCLVSGMEEWSSIMTTKRSKRDQISPERRKSQVTNVNQMWCDKCGESHLPNVPYKYPDVPKSL